MQTSKGKVTQVFAYLCEVMGRKTGQDIGNWQLDYNPAYGGYVINEICTLRGGIKHPFGTSRYKATEFVAICYGAITGASMFEARLQNAPYWLVASKDLTSDCPIFGVDYAKADLALAIHSEENQYIDYHVYFDYNEYLESVVKLRMEALNL